MTYILLFQVKYNIKNIYLINHIILIIIIIILLKNKLIIHKMKTDAQPQNPQNPNVEQPQEENKEQLPQYKYYSFPDGTIYYGETATVNKDNKKIDKPEEITDEEIKKTLKIVRHGYGIMLYEFKDDKYSSKYEGNWYLNKKKGKGKAEYSDGSVYEGDFDNDLYEGNGSLVWNGGYSYVGQWHNGNMEGEGEFRHYDGHTLSGLFFNNYFYIKEQDCFIYPFWTQDEIDAFKSKNIDFIAKQNKNKLDKFSRENIIKVTNELELFTAIDDTYKANKIPLIVRCSDINAEKEDVFELFHDNYREINLRKSYMTLHNTSLGLNIEVFNDIKQKVTEAMTKGLFLIVNFDDLKEKYEYNYDPDIREFYGKMMLSQFMWNPSLFFTNKCSNAHLNRRSDLKMDKNFKFICYSKYIVDENMAEHDLINEIEKRFEKSFPLISINVVIYSAKKSS